MGAGRSALSVLCFLAKAIIEFNKGHYKESLGCIKRILEVHPESPSDLWYGLAVCYHRLGNLPKAKLGFEKVLEIEPTHSMGLCGSALVELSLHVNEFETRQRVVDLLFRSFDSNPRNLLTLKYLSEHYCYCGNF